MKYFHSLGLAVYVVFAAALAAGCAGPERTVGETVDDSAITARVKSELLAAPEVSALNVDVTTYDGQVQLSGFVASPEERQRAEEIAENVEGVKSVANDLIVKAPQ